MKKIIIRCALWLGAGAAIGCAINVQPAVANCYVPQACSTDPLCVGSSRSSEVKANNGKRSAGGGACGKLWQPGPGSDDLTEPGAKNTNQPCGGALAVAC